MSTPEGRVKAKITATLKSFGHELYYLMPIGSSYGAASVDYVGWVRGVPFAIEAKAPGGTPTLRQSNTLMAMRKAGGATFVIDGQEGINELRKWILNVIFTAPPVLEVSQP